MLKKIIMALIITNMSLFGMEENPIKIPDQITDEGKEEAQRRYYYPDVPVARQSKYGKILANCYFTQELPKTSIAGDIAYSNAYKYWRYGSNLPQAGEVISEVKEWTQKVLIRAFQLRNLVLSNLYVDRELLDAVDEINRGISTNPEEVRKWQKIKVLVDEFSKQPIVRRDGFGHD